MINVFANTPQVLVAIKNATMSEIGFDSTNLHVIYEVNGDLKSYQPNRIINALNSIHVDYGYYIISKVDLDLSNWFVPPTGVLSNTFLDLTDVIATDYVGQAGKLIKVNNTEDGLIFGDFEVGTEITKVASVTVGGINAGDSYTIGTIEKNRDTLAAILTKVYYPTLTSPTFGLVHNRGFEIIGSTVNVALSFIYNRGAITGNIVSGVWNPSAFQANRSGTPITYNYFEADGTTVIAGNTANTTKTNHVVIQGANQFKANLDYGIGVQPKDSTNTDYSTPYPAGNSGLQSTSFEGVYPLFATTAAIDTFTQQPLYSMTTQNNIELVLVAESGGNKQGFQIPSVWLSARSLTAIYYFNTVSNQYDTTNKIDDFYTSSITKSIEANNINYTNFTNGTANRGSVKIKLVF